MQMHKFALQRKMSLISLSCCRRDSVIEASLVLLHSLPCRTATSLWLVYSFWFALFKEKACFQALSLLFWELPPPALPELIFTQLDSYFPYNCLSLAHFIGSAGKGRRESHCYSALCLLAHLLMKRQGWVSNQSLQGPGIREPVATYDSGLDWCLGMSKISWIQKSKMCLQEFTFIAFSWPCKPNTYCFEKSELNCPKNLEEDLGFAQGI